jgi:hypothetical protein
MTPRNAGNKDVGEKSRRHKKREWVVGSGEWGDGTNKRGTIVSVLFAPSPRRPVSLSSSLRPPTLFFLAICLLFAILGAAAQQVPQVSREQKWRGDLQYLFAELPKRHKNLFFNITPQRFDREIAEIIESVPKSSDAEIKFALRRLTAMIGDPHTRISFNVDKTYPITLHQFSDGVFVIAATEEYKSLLGAKLIRIGETDIDRAKEAVRPLVIFENEWRFKQQFPDYLTDPDNLHLLKLLSSHDEGDFTFAGGNGNEFTVRMRPVSTQWGIRFITPFDWSPDKTPFHLRNPDRYYWYEYLPDSKTLYLNYRRCARMPGLPFNRVVAALLKFMNQNRVERMVIDLRLNSGGDSSILDPLINALSKRRDIRRQGKLFVLIGRRTFSSAVLNAIELKRETKAILVGEPAGQRPNFYGEVQTMTLPYSRLRVHYSTRFFKTMDGNPQILAPDMEVELSSSDYFSGRDPVLERALHHR